MYIGIFPLHIPFLCAGQVFSDLIMDLEVWIRQIIQWMPLPLSQAMAEAERGHPSSVWWLTLASYCCNYLLHYIEQVDSQLQGQIMFGLHSPLASPYYHLPSRLGILPNDCLPWFARSIYFPLSLFPACLYFKVLLSFWVLVKLLSRSSTAAWITQRINEWEW